MKNTNELPTRLVLAQDHVESEMNNGGPTAAFYSQGVANATKEITDIIRPLTSVFRAVEMDPSLSFEGRIKKKELIKSDAKKALNSLKDKRTLNEKIFEIEEKLVKEEPEKTTLGYMKRKEQRKLVRDLNLKQHRLNDFYLEANKTGDYQLAFSIEELADPFAMIDDDIRKEGAEIRLRRDNAAPFVKIDGLQFVENQLDYLFASAKKCVEEL